MYEQYIEWKNSQLLADIVRSQLQQYAINHVVDKRLQGFSTLNPKAKKTVYQKETVPVVLIKMTEVIFKWTSPLSSIRASDYYLKLSLGSWCSTTHPMNSSLHGMKWEGLDIEASMSVNDVQLYDLKVELFDVNPESTDQILVGKGNVYIHESIGQGYGKNTNYHISISLSGKEPVGYLSIDLIAQLTFKQLEHLPDPFEKNRLEILGTAGLMEPISIITNHNNDDPNLYITGNSYCNRLEEKRFRELVSDLRGDHTNKEVSQISIMRMLSGDVAISKILQAQNSTELLRPVKVRLLHNKVMTYI